MRDGPGLALECPDSTSEYRPRPPPHMGAIVRASAPLPSTPVGHEGEAVHMHDAAAAGRGVELPSDEPERVLQAGLRHKLCRGAADTGQ